MQLHDVLDLVDGVPDAICEPRDFLHLRWSPNRSIGVRLDAADVYDGGSVGKQVLNFDREVRQDARDAMRSDSITRHLGAGSMRTSDDDVVSNGRLVRNHMRLSVVALNGVFARGGERLVYILVHLVQRL